MRAVPIVLAGDVAARSASPRVDLLRRLWSSRGVTFGAPLLVALALMAVLAPYIVSYPPTRPFPAEALQAPDAGHWMGTDEIGRDIFSRIVAGAGVSLQVGIMASSISLFFGVVLGLLAGYRSGWVGAVIMRLVDVMLAMPGLLLALAIVASLGPSLVNVMMGVGIASVPRFTRVMRGCVLTAKENVYVLGMGAQPPTPEWGLMLAKGRDYLRTAWWISTFPGLAIMLTVLAVNMLGDGLRDALDPRLRL